MEILSHIRFCRYCLAVNVIGFVYSGFQACDLTYNLGTEKHVISHHLRYHFDFAMDQASCDLHSRIQGDCTLSIL